MLCDTSNSALIDNTQRPTLGRESDPEISLRVLEFSDDRMWLAQRRGVLAGEARLIAAGTSIGNPVKDLELPLAHWRACDV